MALRFMLDMLKTTLHTRLLAFFKDSTELPLSQQAFSKLRSHFTHYPFEKMVRTTVFENYSSQNPTWRGFHLLAINGTHASLPVCKQTIKAFGVFGSENCPNADISVLYDVLSGWIIDPIIGKANMNKREYARRHIEFLRQTLPQISKNTILLMDRGYPSKAMIELMENSEISFVMRVSSKFIPEVNDAPIGDTTVTLKDGSQLRVIKFTLNSGETERLVTNVFSLNCDDFKALYHMRWGIETAYFKLKRELSLEKFSGKTENSIFQDFWASVVIFNFVAVVQAEADEVVKKRHDGKKLKHIYHARSSDLIITLRDQLIFTTFQPNSKEAAAEFQRLLILIAGSLSAVRPNRSFERNFRSSRVNNNLNRQLDDNLLNNLLQTPVPAQSADITLWHGIIFFLIGVAGILLLRFIHINVKAYGIAFQLPQADIPHLHSVLSDTIRDKDKCKLHVAICSGIDTPQILGFRRSVILLPLRNYQKQELSAIIAHKYQHYLHHDIWLRLILQLITILFWWNPLVYLLKQNTETALDILCDMVLLRNEPFERVRAYGKILVKFAPKQNRNTHEWAAQFVCSKTVFSRYDYMVHGNKRKRHGALITFWCIISITLTILSFSFILQSAYEPEAADYTAIPIENTDLYFNEQGILCTRVNGVEMQGTNNLRLYEPAFTREEYAAKIAASRVTKKSQISTIMAAFAKETTTDDEELIKRLEDIIEELRKEK